MHPTLLVILYAILGGLVPALIWLFFWLREDIHPEPKRLIVKAFWGGVVAVPLALLLEGAIYCGISFFFIPSSQAFICGSENPMLLPWIGFFPVISLWLFSFAEELMKYKCAKHYVLRGSNFDEPVDAMIYLITVALGFAAFENVFFLYSAFQYNMTEGLVVSNLRFLGATLLHAMSSALLGYSIASAFYKYGAIQRHHVAAGLIIATLLHGLFNTIITSRGELGDSLQTSILILSLTAIFIIFAFDRVKKIKRDSIQ
jgi:protease PrsW